MEFSRYKGKLKDNDNDILRQLDVADKFLSSALQTCMEYLLGELSITSTRLKREPLYSQASDLGDPQIAIDSAVPKSESSFSSETSSKICGTLNQSSLESGTHCSDWSGRDLNSERLFGQQNNPTKDSNVIRVIQVSYKPFLSSACLGTCKIRRFVVNKAMLGSTTVQNANFQHQAAKRMRPAKNVARSTNNCTARRCTEYQQTL